jgi:hypothetical protein
MKRIFSVVFSLILPLTAVETSQAAMIESAYRPPEESFAAAANRWADVYSSATRDPRSVFNQSRPYIRVLDTSSIPVWSKGLDTLQEAFEFARDARVYYDPLLPEFPRRTTWLYPQDGCFIRAEHVANTFQKAGHVLPAKVFAFGRLQLKTPFARGGSASWWYHVAAAVQVDGKAYVLDPSVEPSGPIQLDEWLKRFAPKDARTLRVSFCDHNAYGPQSRCTGGPERDERRSLETQSYYLPLEWETVNSLGYKPLDILGDLPPWHLQTPTGPEPASDRFRN